MKTSTGPLWLDTESGAVVADEPVHGRLLVPAGVEVTPEVQAAIDRHVVDHDEPALPAQVDPDTAGDAEPALDVDALAKLPKADLVAQAEALGVDASGNKNEIAERIVAAGATQADAVE